MRTTAYPDKVKEAGKAASNALTSAIQSILLFFCLLFSLRFFMLLFHEGGHALADMTQGGKIRLLYVHPFYFSGYARSTVSLNQVLNHAAGPAVVVLVSLLIFILLWKRRSVALLPLLMLFPWVAMETGTNALDIARTGDYTNIIRLTGLPQSVITIPCLVLFIVGVFIFLSLMPLLGLNPKDWRTLFVLPAATLFWSGVSIVAAHRIVPGSPVDVIYHMGESVIRTAEGVWPRGVALVLLIAGLYVTLYRLAYRRLPAGVRSEAARLTWSDLRIPGLVAAACLIAGLILIH